MEGAADSVARVLDEWAQIKPDLDVSPIAIIARMARIRTIIDAQQARVFGTAGITPADFPVLVTLRRRVPPYRLTHTALARDLGLTAGTVTARVDHLETLGLVERQADPADARVRWVRLTRKGVTVVDSLIPEHLAVERELLAGVSPAERDDLAAALATLLADLENRYG